jgi:hypothetical protein
MRAFFRQRHVRNTQLLHHHADAHPISRPLFARAVDRVYIQRNARAVRRMVYPDTPGTDGELAAGEVEKPMKARKKQTAKYGRALEMDAMDEDL